MDKIMKLPAAKTEYTLEDVLYMTKTLGIMYPVAPDEYSQVNLCGEACFISDEKIKEQWIERK